MRSQETIDFNQINWKVCTLFSYVSTLSIARREKYNDTKVIDEIKKKQRQ
jgi:hypothetical protein